MSLYMCIIIIVHFLQLEEKAQIHFNLETPWAFGFYLLIFLSPLGKRGEANLLESQAGLKTSESQFTLLIFHMLLSLTAELSIFFLFFFSESL